MNWYIFVIICFFNFLAMIYHFQNMLFIFFFIFWASLVAQMVKSLPTMLETWVQSLGWEDPLKKGTATHSSILAWRIPWTEEFGSCSPWDRKESEPTE